MARPLRIEMANGLYHVTARGWERRVIVDSDRDREDWLRLLDRVVTRSNWRVFSWVLMSNHFHMFLRTREPNLLAICRARNPRSTGISPGCGRRPRLSREVRLGRGDARATCR